MIDQSAEAVVHFVFSEAARFQEQFARGDFLTGLEPPFDAFHSIPNGKADGGNLPIGPEAEKRIRSFVEREVAKRGYEGRLEIAPLVRQFKEEIVATFLRSAAKISDAEAKASFERSIALSVQRIKECTHLVPCQLVNLSDPDRFTIGPVKFRHFDTRWPDVQAELQSWPKNPSYDAKCRERLRRDVQNYYSKFNWIAEATVDDREIVPTRNVALVMVKTAVEGLRLLLGGQHSDRLVMSGAAGQSDARSHIVLSGDGIEQVEVAYHAPIYPIDNDGWKWIASDDACALRRILGVAISFRFLAPEPTPLAIRYTDALHWYGRATEDTSAAAQLVMYLMAVERMLLPNYTSAVRSTIKNRSVFFCDWDKHNQKIERLYGARNDLSHGKCSPLAPELRDTAELARQFARHVLIGTLWQSESALKSTEFSPLILEAALEEFHEKHKRREKERANSKRAR